MQAKPKCICWLASDLDQEDKGVNYSMKIYCPFLLVDSNISVVITKVSLEEKAVLISCSS